MLSQLAVGRRREVRTALLALVAGVAMGLGSVPWTGLAWNGVALAADPENTAASGLTVPSVFVEPASGEELARLTQIYRQHIETLANPFMEGRAPGTNGNRVAADYLEFHFKKYGLSPAFAVGDVARASFRQEFEAPPSSRPGDSLVKEREVAKVMGGAGEVALVAGVDFEATASSGNEAFAGPLAFAGYSIEEGPDGYTSYPEGMAEDALKDKVVMVFRFEPVNDEGKSRWASQRWTAKAAIEPKIRAAVERGAKGVIIVNPPEVQDDRVERLDGWNISSRRRFDVPIVLMSAKGAETMLRAINPDGPSVLELRKRADAGGGIEDLGGTVALDIATKRVPLMTDNVGAVLEGKGALKDEIVVIGAHYDHVGYGYFGSRDGASGRGKIHPGADDNASGTAGVLQAAEQMAKWYAALPEGASARSVLFIGFCAEESGLNGSRFYATNPIAPIGKHQAMINLDMIGRLRKDAIEAYGVGTAKGFADWLKPYFDASGFTISPRNSGLGPSDHASFASEGVPVIFLHTGLHEEYHRTVDTADTINSEGGARVSDLAARVAFGMATMPERLEFTNARGRAGETGPAERPKAHGEEGGTEPQANEEREGGDRPAMGPQRSSVRFGIAPGDYSESEPGVLVGEVIEGLPAQRAGLQKGDRIIKWNGQDVESVEGWMPLLVAAKPGDKVTIVYIRDGKEQTTTAELVGRGSEGQ